jgi:putative transposase
MGRDRVERLMRLAGIDGVRRGKHRGSPESEPQTRHPNHVNRRWGRPSRRPGSVADFTYMWTTAAFCYVSFINDVFSHPILG